MIRRLLLPLVIAFRFTAVTGLVLAALGAALQNRSLLIVGILMVIAGSLR